MKLYGMIFVVLLAFITIGTASADTITVNNSTGTIANYTSIQDAVDAAINGDTILVYSGTYTEIVSVDKELTIESDSGNPDDTIVLITSPSNYVILVEENNVNINGFSVVGLNNNTGILLSGVEGCTISDNVLSDNFAGIRLDHSSNNVVSGNNASLNNDTGIGLQDSSYNTLNDNTANLNLDVGIWLSNSSNNMLSDNTANLNTEKGIGLLDSDDNTLDRNIVNLNTETGIDLLNSNNNIFDSNNVLNNSEGIILENSSINRLESNIVSYNLDDGIFLENSSDNMLLSNTANWNGNVSDDSAYAGIKLLYSINNTLSSNTVSWNDDTGIGLFDSNNNILNSNVLSYNLDDGIYLENSNNNTLSSNTASDNYYGIRVVESSDNELLDNIADLNEHAGISVRQSSTTNTLSNNTANSNVDIGIGLLNSSENTFTDNTVSNNSYGIYVENASSNLLFNNYFNNTNNANFLGTNDNTWNTTRIVGTNIVGGIYLGGNFWADPDGTGFSQVTDDLNGDGICDEQYNLTDPVFDIDFLPLSIVNDDLLPVINITSPADGSGTNVSSVTVSGLVNGTGSMPLVTVNGVAAATTIVDFDGTFTATVPLVAGSNTIYANVTDAAGNTGTTSMNVFFDEFDPVINITSPADGSSTKSSSITVSGLVDGTNSVPVVTVNGVNAATTLVDYNGTFTATVPLVLGSNTIYANVTDSAGNTNTTFVNVTRTSSSSGSGSSSGGGGGGGATGEAFENILVKDAATSKVITGELSRYDFGEEKCHIIYVQFSGLINAGQISTLIEVLKDTSTLVDSSAPGIVYQNMNIWVGNAAFSDDKLEDSVIGFRVSKEWLSENGIDSSSVSLYRHNGGKWNQLSTNNVDEDDEYIYFEARTPGFSPFAISGFEEGAEIVHGEDNTTASEDDAPAEENEDSQPEPNGIPWISTGSMVLILVGVHLIMRKRN
ncbi:NosD domain-containing protein [Methanococcoides sp. LMO-2]|uniref:NosD domain-containing protein n=1 Tax=Methanococcoides cohabitans TaxID=3136559 RepID=A0ABU9KPW6_9EURY